MPESRMDKMIEMNIRNDLYGSMLTIRQREIINLYYEENFSLSEIAEEFSISRQAVHDTLKKAEKALAVYERKLGLVEKFKKSEKAVRSIDKIIEKLVKEHSEDKKLTSQLEKIKQEIYRIDKSSP